MDIRQSLNEVRNRMQRAIRTSGRQPGSVKLIAVSKTYSAEIIRSAFAVGQTRFGESRIQEAEQKIKVLEESIEWHLIGHLQTNKVKTAVKYFDVIHSVDSIRLIDELEKQAEPTGKIQSILLQVNVSGEETKYGVKEKDLPALIERSMSSHHLKLLGLMTIPPFSVDPEDSRVYMKRIKEIAFEELAVKRYLSEVNIELSMGMSHDFEVAIEEGATMIRVGTAIFGSRDLKHVRSAA
ncbi:YggS family pyridoxal phosphate-dependent enzyme [bacterium]|nr:YggS family pyridoxal phosphate-dependent enzyme [candidate division CSSED10-310 bacterium]